MRSVRGIKGLRRGPSRPRNMIGPSAPQRADNWMQRRPRDNYGFAPGREPALNPLGQNDAGLRLLDGMQRGIEPAPLSGATPGGGPWVRSGKRTRSYFGP